MCKAPVRFHLPAAVAVMAGGISKIIYPPYGASKFYHFLLAVDTTQSTNSNRLKLYVDGDQITSFSVETYPSQDLDTKVNSTSYPNAVGNFNFIIEPTTFSKSFPILLK